MLEFLERDFLYYPSKATEDWDEPTGLSVTEVEFATPQGQIHGWWCPIDNPRYVVHYSHGNAGNVSGRLHQIVQWHAVGAAVLIYDYPGYGRSTGVPSEPGCYAAGHAAYQWLQAAGYADPRKLLFYGKSLGAAIAIELAVSLGEASHLALVVYSPFISIPEMARIMFPHLPVYHLLNTRFDNEMKLRRYQGYLLLGHGTEDELVPFAQGQRLYEVCPATRKRFLAFSGAGHGSPPVEFYDTVARLVEKPPAISTS